MSLRGSLENPAAFISTLASPMEAASKALRGGRTSSVRQADSGIGVHRSAPSRNPIPLRMNAAGGKLHLSSSSANSSSLYLSATTATGLPHMAPARCSVETSGRSGGVRQSTGRRP